MRERGEPFWKQTTGFFGFTKAPFYIEQSKAQILAYDLQSQHMPEEARSKEDYARYSLTKQHVAEFKKAVKEGDMAGRQKVFEAINADVRSGRLHMDNVDKFIRKVGGEPLEQTVQALPLPDAMKVWKVATPEEKMRLAGIFVTKVINYADRHPEEYQRLSGRIDQMLAEIATDHRNRIAMEVSSNASSR